MNNLIEVSMSSASPAARYTSAQAMEERPHSSLTVHTTVGRSRMTRDLSLFSL